jgi:hypothetical protein
VSPTFDVSGLTVAVEGLEPGAVADVEAMLDPCGPGPQDATPDVVLAHDPVGPGTFTDLQRDARDGRLTGTDGERFFLLEHDRACALPRVGELPARFELQAGFPTGRTLAGLVRPVLQLGHVVRGAAVAHSAAVVLDGRAVLVAGWSESGKTETALALMEDGARFLSDKWTVLAPDGTARVFPIGVGVRGWTLAHLPRLDAALGKAARRRLSVAAAARKAVTPLQRGRAADPLDRLVSLADRISVTPTELRRLSGDDPHAPWRAPLGAVERLTTVPDGAGVEVRPADPAWVARRLAVTADMERRPIFELHDRYRWTAPKTAPDVRERLAEDERALLERALAGVTVLEVRAPFPTDPRQVGQALARAL